MGDPIGSTAIIVVGEPLPAAGTGGGIATTTSMTSAPLSASGGREYRKGNWTIHETMVLITAKKMDDERRMKGGERERSKTAELVEVGRELLLGQRVYAEPEPVQRQVGQPPQGPQEGEGIREPADRRPDVILADGETRAEGAEPPLQPTLRGVRDPP